MEKPNSILIMPDGEQVGTYTDIILNSNDVISYGDDNELFFVRGVLYDFSNSTRDDAERIQYVKLEKCTADAKTIKEWIKGK